MIFFLSIFVPCTANKITARTIFMKKESLFVFLLLGSIITCLLNAAPVSNDAELHHLYALAGKNLTYSSSIPDECIIELCTKIEKQTRDAGDYDNMFRVQLIAVNSNCLKGAVGLAVSKAQQMYELARDLNSDLGKALAIQAMGITLMHSNESKQAYTAFLEAEDKLRNLNGDDLKMRLLIQQMHVCTLLGKMGELQYYLIEAGKLLDKTDLQNKSDYIFYFKCYQAFYYLGIKDLEQSRLSLKQVKELRLTDGTFDRWYYNVAFRFYELSGDYAEALTYCDSTVTVVLKNGNMNEYKYVIIDKAGLLEKLGAKKEACNMYDKAFYLSDSLNMVYYSQQIDSLHVTYWVDQMELENAAMHNKMLTWILLFSFFILIVADFLVYISLKKNKRLELSREKLEKTRQETAYSIQSKNLFLSNMSHELRTPLNAIVGFANLLASESALDDETRQQCGDLIKQNSELLLKLFHDVADLSALKEDNIRFMFEHCDVLILCANVIDTVEKVKRTSAAISFETSLTSLDINTDSGRLQQVLINLLINATKFTQEGRIVLKLDIDEERQEAIFAIEDTGCGIPLEKQPHIFERFEKLHEGVQGAGLGLSICQLIIENIGGKIWIDSSYTNGTRFVFTHPLHNERQ